MRCHYEVLGLEMTANVDEIKKAYRKNALIWHPGNKIELLN
jgi:DnaJ homolog subfamily A member 5